MSKQSINRRTLRLFWQFTRPNKGLFWYGTIMVMVSIIIADILPPLLIAGAFDTIQRLQATGQAVRFDDLSTYVWQYAALLTISMVTWRTQAWSVWRYSILAERRIYEHIFNHLQRMGSRFHADRFGGALVSQSSKFASAYDRFIGDFTWNILTGVTAFVASLVVLYRTYWQYALVLNIAMFVYIALIWSRMKKQAPVNQALAHEESKRTANLADNITNVSTVNAFGGESHEQAYFGKQTAKTAHAYLKLMRVQMLNETISHAGTNVVNILAFLVGVIAVTKFDAPVGILFLAISYTVALARRLWDSMFILKNLNRMFGDATEMTEILEMEPEIKDQASAAELVPTRGDIRMRDVTFAYQEQSSKPLFKNLDLHIKPGEKVGLVGHSGGGKTTITKLLLRFMDIQKGQILIDGQDIASVTQASLRSHIASVPQEPLLFHRTLAENIAYGRPDASMKEIIAVAKLAHAHEFVKELPAGYETLVGERGIKLSGGQRQRVAIARAMIKNAPILVLDEATSALDSQSEALIQDALWKLMEGRTAIVIAHRLSTIQKMDRIIVMDKGQIAEEGTHKELIAKGGIYANLWSHQSGGFLEE